MLKIVDVNNVLIGIQYDYLNYTADVKTNTKILGTKKSVRNLLKKPQQLCQILKICVLALLLVDFQILRFIFLNTSLRREEKIKSHLDKTKIKNFCKV